jgi:aminoglycoside phosphotransferase (APT) family kinase protein
LSALPFDHAVLERWLADRDLCAGPIRLRRIGDGLSNLTYLVTDGRRTVVLRRPPPPPLPPGGNDMRREARILTALADTAVPVPRVLATAEPGEVMDVPCYVMEHLDGVVATGSLPVHLDTESGRAATAEAFIDVLATLHRIDWRARGLSDLGRPGGFLTRQLHRLPRLITAPDGALPEPFGTLRERLRDTRPSSSDPALLHGDYRFGNVMLARDLPARLLGVLDWELAGIGDPLVDLGYTLATYAVPGEPAHALTAMSTLTLAPGFPGRAELAARYAGRTGADLTRLPWYEGFALFKLAVLFEYNRRKARSGGGDPYYADPTLVTGLLAACRRAVRGDPRHNAALRTSSHTS